MKDVFVACQSIIVIQMVPVILNEHVTVDTIFASSTEITLLSLFLILFQIELSLIKVRRRFGIYSEVK